MAAPLTTTSFTGATGPAAMLPQSQMRISVDLVRFCINQADLVFLHHPDYFG